MRDCITTRTSFTNVVCRLCLDAVELNLTTAELTAPLACCIRPKLSRASPSNADHSVHSPRIAPILWAADIFVFFVATCVTNHKPFSESFQAVEALSPFRLPNSCFWKVSGPLER